MKQTDLATADTPVSVARILRHAAQLYYESASELDSAWQDSNAGKPWTRIARELEGLADKIERREK